MASDIPASFTWSEHDYMALTRGARMLQDRGYDSPIMRAGFLFLGHLFLVIGLLVAVMALSGGEGKNGPTPPSVVFASLGFSAIAAYALFTRWYGLRWMTNRAFRASQLVGLKVSYVFRPTEIESTSRLIQSRRAWVVITKVVEFRDAFILIAGDSAEWLPKSAFVEPFDEARFVDLVQETLRIYRFIDRNAFLEGDSPRPTGPYSSDGPPDDLDEFDESTDVKPRG